MRRKHAPLTIVLVVLVGWTAVSPAHSQVSRQDKACADTTDAEAAIQACTQLYENRGLGKRNRAIALGNRGAAYKSLGRYPEALADFEQASELDSDNPQYYGQRGDVHIRTGELDAAIEDFTTALSHSSRFAWGYQGRGRAYFAKGDGAKAVADFNEALRLKPGDFILLTQRGRASNLAKLYDQAVSDLSKAMKHAKFETLLPKERADLIAQRSFAYVKQRRLSEARTDVDDALKLAPKSAFAIGVGGLIDEEDGNRDNARSAFNRALAIEPDLQLAKAGLDRLGGGGQVDDADKDREPVAQSDPPKPSRESSARRKDDDEPRDDPEMCAKYVPEIGRTVKIKCD
ncbi:tetratricopeptide repeat protein [Hyphomicrobium album]|nr:tetratricopeptide repeat protein [Hyphomicrobium album]